MKLESYLKVIAKDPDYEVIAEPIDGMVDVWKILVGSRGMSLGTVSDLHQTLDFSQVTLAVIYDR